MKYLFILSCVVFINLQVGAVDFTSTETDLGMNEGKNLANSLKSSYGNVDNMQNNVFTPMTSETELSTVDGSSSAKVNITCDTSSSVFARFSYIGDSDIDINIQLDLDLDGTFDKSTNFNGISGIHSSGVIVCSAGTFSNCIYYNWSFNLSTNNIELVQVAHSDSSGSYCINNSCGSIASSQKSRILGDIAGSAGVTLQQSSSDFTITKIYTSSSYVDLYGQDYSTCSNSGSSNYTASIGGTPSTSQLEAEASALDESNDGYYILQASAENEANNTIENSDLTDILAVSAVSSLATVDANDPTQINYTAYYQDENGEWVNKNDSASVAFETVTEPQGCMVEWEEVSTTVVSDGGVRGQTTSGLSTTIKSEIRECSGDDYSTCPVNDNESIKYDCGSLGNSVAEAAAAMTTVNNLSNDMTCSTN